MQRSLIYFFIITLFAWSALFSLAYLTEPVDDNGQTSDLLVFTFLGIAYCASTLTIGFIFSLIKTFLPDQKLPHLLLRDSLIHGAIVSLAIIGLLTLQLLRAFNIINAVLWVAIVIAIAWIVESGRKAASPESTSQNSGKITNKKMTKGRN